jgi:hypothetical protein
MTQLNQAARKDLATRSLLSDTTLRMVARCGVDLLSFKEGLDVSTKLVGNDGDVSPLIADGYEFAGFDIKGQAIRLERLEGLFYPVTSVGRG